MKSAILIGLGSNMGDRLAHLRSAINHLNHHPNLQIQAISPIYHSDALLTENAPSSWQLPFLNAVVSIDSALSPYELLDALQHIETRMGRPLKHDTWSPRIIDLDILLFHNEQISDATLNIPHRAFRDRPFALFPMSDVLPDWVDPHTHQTLYSLATSLGSRFDGSAPLGTRQIPHRLEEPLLMGIINVTPDSFSDGGRWMPLERAFSHAQSLIQDGAEYLDIGGESTRPNAETISHEEEWRRIAPLLKEISDKKSDFLTPPKISIDSRHIETYEKAMEFGFDLINKVNGYDDARSIEFLQNTEKPFVLMHQCSIPADPLRILTTHQSAHDSVLAWFQEKMHFLDKIKIDCTRLIIDPGFGFGKTTHHNLNLIAHIDAFHTLNAPILIGHSRKLFMRSFDDSPPDKRDLHTAILSFYFAQKHVSYVRVHDVKSSRLALNICQEIFSKS